MEQAQGNGSGRLSSVGQFVTVEDVRLHFVRAGAGQTVVLLHGNAGFAQDYDALLPLLSEQGYEAIAFDRPGHGLSERPNGTSVTAEAQALLLRAALRELEIARPIIMYVTSSWGTLRSSRCTIAL